MTTRSSLTLSGLALFAVGLIVGAFVANRVDRNVQPKATDTSIVFPDKNYTDTGSFVSVSGRWDGPGVGYKNNAAIINCDHQQSNCGFYTVQQIGINQISSLDIPFELPITHWDDFVITATDEGQDGGITCVKNTINIDRKRGTAELVMEPINQSKLNCAKTDNKIYKWWLSGSLWYDQMRARNEAAKASR